MSDLQSLLRELSEDTNLRRAFAASPAAVLRARGYDPALFTVPDHIDLATLETNLQVWAAENDKAVQTAPVEENAFALEAGLDKHQRVRRRLGRGRQASRRMEGAAESGPLGVTAALPPFTPPETPASVEAPIASGEGPVAEAASNDEAAAAAGEALEKAEKTDKAGKTKPARASKAEPVSAAAGDQDAYPSAWFGTYGTAVTRALVSGAEASRLVPETVIDVDDRIRVTETDKVPFRWLCRLVIVAGNGTRWSGTGWLAGPRLVLTAGHCVYMHNQGGWAQRIQVSLYGANGDFQAPVEAEDAASVGGWVNSADPDQDYGAVALSADIQAPGWFGFGSFADAALSASVGNIAGFPIDKPVGTLWGHARRFSEVRPSALLYEIDTYGGMSGAPVICWNGEDYIVVGIHNYGDIAGNRATRINPTVYQNIEAWLAEYA